MFFVVALAMLGVSEMMAQDVAKNNELLCGIGQFMNRNGNTPFCKNCPDGSYNDKDEHTNISCKPCTRYYPDLDYVEELEHCTRERDTIFKRCQDKRYVRYDSSLERYECILCSTTDCPGRSECCSTTVTTTSPVTTTTSTPAATTTTDIQSPTPFKPGSYKPSVTKCGDVVTKDCLTTEHVNRNCVHFIESVEKFAQCQNCPNIKHIADDCSDADKSSLSTGVITGIVVSSVILFIAGVVVFIYLCYRRRNKQRALKYQMVNKEPSVKTDIHEPIKFNCHLDEICIE